MRSRERDAGQVRIVPELRKLVEFRRLNFMDSDYGVAEKVDAVFCRNVIIYFDRPTQEKILGRLSSYLKPGGYLFVGHSETSARYGSAAGGAGAGACTGSCMADAGNGCREVYVQPGESHLVRGPAILRTVLGSCVGVTFWHAGLEIGALCHPMLPHHPETGGQAEPRSGAALRGFRDSRPGGSIRCAGHPAGEIQVKLFGGADVLQVQRHESASDRGQAEPRNGAGGSARRGIRRGGVATRRARRFSHSTFIPSTGEVRLRRLGVDGGKRRAGGDGRREGSGFDRGRFSRGTPDTGACALVRSCDRGDRDCGRSVCGGGEDRRRGPGRDYAGHRDAAHGRHDFSAEDHDAASYPGGDLFEPGGGRDAQCAGGAGKRRGGDRDQAAAGGAAISGRSEHDAVRCGEGGCRARLRPAEPKAHGGTQADGGCGFVRGRRSRWRRPRRRWS